MYAEVSGYFIVESKLPNVHLNLPCGPKLSGGLVHGRREFEAAGICHRDLYFDDCTVPDDDTVSAAPPSFPLHHHDRIPSLRCAARAQRNPIFVPALHCSLGFAKSPCRSESTALAAPFPARVQPASASGRRRALTRVLSPTGGLTRPGPARRSAASSTSAMPSRASPSTAARAWAAPARSSRSG